MMMSELENLDKACEMTVFPLHHRATTGHVSCLFRLKRLEKPNRSGDSPSESTGNDRGTTLNTGEQTVQDPLSGEQRLIGGQLVRDGPGSSDGPVLHHRMFRLDALEFGLEDDVLVARACGSNQRHLITSFR